MKQFYETYCTADEKLSAVLRQIAPRADQVFRDQYVLEFLGGKDFLFIDEEYRLHLPDKALLQQKLRDIYDSEEEK